MQERQSSGSNFGRTVSQIYLRLRVPKGYECESVPPGSYRVGYYLPGNMCK